MNDQFHNPYEPNTVEAREIVWENKNGMIRAAQIIVVALSLGLFILLCVNLFNFLNDAQPLNWKLTTMTLVGVVIFVASVPASFIAPIAIANGIRVTPAEPSAMYSQLFEFFRTQLIVGCAILESAGFLNLYMFALDHHLVSLVIAMLSVGLLLVRFPTTKKVQAWIADRLPQ